MWNTKIFFPQVVTVNARNASSKFSYAITEILKLNALNVVKISTFLCENMLYYF